jgi:hypothetical protein
MAGFVEFCHSVALDIGFGIEAELFFDEIFHRESMAVPAKAPFDAVASHGFISGNNIFNRTRDKMAKMRQASSKGGSVVKYEFRRTFPLRN